MKPKPPSLKPEQRNVLRRDLNDAVRTEGRFSEAKAWASIGKLICVYLLLLHTDEVMRTEYTLLTLLTFLILPKLIEKLPALRGSNAPASKPAH